MYRISSTSRWHCVALVIGSILMASCFIVKRVHSTPIPKEGGKPILYDIPVGSTWIYSETKHVNGRKSERERRFYLAEVSVGSDSKIVTINEVVDIKNTKHRIPYETLEISSTGLYRLAVGVYKREPPECLMTLPYQKETKWSGKYRLDRIPPVPMIYESKSSALELVKVVGGQFDAIRVDTTFTNSSIISNTTTYYNPKIGIIKQIDEDSVLELKSFMLPGKK